MASFRSFVEPDLSAVERPDRALVRGVAATIHATWFAESARPPVWILRASPDEYVLQVELPEECGVLLDDMRRVESVSVPRVHYVGAAVSPSNPGQMMIVVKVSKQDSDVVLVKERVIQLYVKRRPEDPALEAAAAAAAASGSGPAVSVGSKRARPA